MQEEWWSVWQPRCKDSHRGLHSVLASPPADSRKLYWALHQSNPDLSMEVHGRIIRWAKALFPTKGVEGNRRGLTRKPWEFTPPQCPVQIPIWLNYSLQTVALTKLSFSLRVYNENLTQDNSWYIMAMESFTQALSVPLFLNSMSPTQTNACL